MTFQITPAKKEQVPLLLAYAGPSGSGKTWSALETATGIKEVHGGPIVLIDTENKRALHYANDFDFMHMRLDPPFSSERYLEALKAAEALSPSCIIIDSMSHEHEGEGGVLDYREKIIAEKVARAKERGDSRKEWQIQEALNFSSWADAKVYRKKLLLALTRTNSSVIMCFRTKEIVSPTKGKNGKMEVVDMGFTPITDDSFVYEATIGLTFKPNSRGVPSFDDLRPGEAKGVKRPAWSECIIRNGDQISRKHGRLLAEWARGDEVDVDALLMAAQSEANKGRDAITKHFASLSQGQQLALSKFKEKLWTDAKKADAAAALAAAENEPA